MRQKSWHETVFGPDRYQVMSDEIANALSVGGLHSVYGTRRWSRRDIHQETEQESLDREVRVAYSPDFDSDAWVWGREWWITNRAGLSDRLIVWTEDRSGRIVRGWTRHKTESETRAYDTPGDRSCPVEAAWLPSIEPGLVSFPAYPFQLLRDQHDHPKVAETVRNLLRIRNVDLKGGRL